MTNFTYAWSDENHTCLKLDIEGQPSIFIPAVFNNADYMEYLKWCTKTSSEAQEYVAPPEPSEPTAEEKLARSGLTVEELKGLLGLN